MTSTFIDLERDFYHVYGKAMSSWAILEGMLAAYFHAITGMDSQIARSVFYSARSFRSRADLLGSVINHAKTTPDGKRAIELMVFKSISYSSVRNKLAHDGHIIRPDTPERVGGIFIRSATGSEALSLEHIQLATQNFNNLATAMAFSSGARTLLLEPELSVQLLGLLPTNALDPLKDRNAVDRIVSELARLAS